MRIKIAQFEGEVAPENITFDKGNVIDNILNKILYFNVVIKKGSDGYGVNLDVPYFETWEDDDLSGMIWERLKDFEINEQ